MLKIKISKLIELERVKKNLRIKRVEKSDNHIRQKSMTNKEINQQVTLNLFALQSEIFREYNKTLRLRIFILIFIDI